MLAKECGSMLTILKYVLWFAGATLALLGDWWFNFTEEDPKNPSRKRLTGAGRIFLPIGVLCFALGAAVFVYDDVQSARESTNQSSTIEALRRSSDTNALMLARLVASLDAQTVSQAQTNVSLRSNLLASLGNAELRRVARKDPALWSTLADMQARLGGKAENLRRLKESNPAL